MRGPTRYAGTAPQDHVDLIHKLDGIIRGVGKRYRGRYCLPMEKIRRGWLYLCHLEGRPSSQACACVPRWDSDCEWDLDNDKPMIGRPPRRVGLLIKSDVFERALAKSLGVSSINYSQRLEIILREVWGESRSGRMMR